MADIVAPAVRSRMMSGIRSKDTRQEISVRKGLHAAGFRFRLHRKDLPGTPDITLPRYRAVIFVHGCFWHGHDCRLFKLPTTNSAKWEAKITTNQRRDLDSARRLQELGWRVCTVWECAMRGANKVNVDQIIEVVSEWLENSNHCLEIRGETT